MTGRAKRLTVIVGVLASVAVVAGSVIAPNPAAAAKKDESTGDFTIKATLFWYFGGFTATGAIDDAGDAHSTDIGLALDGALGTIQIDLDDDGTFTIAGGTEAYQDLTGGGTWTCKCSWKVYKNKPMDEPIFTCDYTLKGSTP